MKRDDIKVLLVIIICPLALGWSYYTWCSFAADRYNANLGTNYSALDMMLGVHKTARNFR